MTAFPELPQSYERKPRRLTFARFLFLSFVSAVAIVVLYFGIGFWHIARGAQLLLQSKNDVMVALEEVDMRKAESAVVRARKGLDKLRYGVSYFSYLENVTLTRDNYQAVVLVLGIADTMLDTAADGVAIVEDVFAEAGLEEELFANNDIAEVGYGSFSDAERAALITVFARFTPLLRDMQSDLQLAEQDLERVQSLGVHPALATQVDEVVELLPKVISLVDVLTPFSAIAEQFGGVGAERQFLILFLNNAELRPGGGFIGYYGLLTTKDGQIVDLVTDDSYAVDDLVCGRPPRYDQSNCPVPYFVNPPPPYRSFLDQYNWYFRDGTWAPDFEQTSRDTVQLFRQEHAHAGVPVPEIHGVVGITPTFISDLLTLTGPITVNDITYTSENLYEILQHQVEQDYVDQGLSEEDRKSILGPVTEAAVDALLDLSPSDWPEFFELLNEEFAQKSIALMSYDDATQKALIDAHWAAVINPGLADDTLMLVDANLGGLKTDLVMERDVTYQLRPYNGGYRATVTIVYENTATVADYKTNRYRTYLRLFVPRGSELVYAQGIMKDSPDRDPTRSPGAVAVADEFGLTSFGGFAFVDLGATHTVRFVYDLPQTVVAAIDRGYYTLQLLKQMGGYDNRVNLDLGFDQVVRFASPPEREDDFGDDSYIFRTDLHTDRHFWVVLDE
ncbi:DUF4012 domain-containing protein [Patescibacteria group bacterium]|nr:DUF4012 domain-containing protein [Patescibacteria group bacterium]